MIESNEVLFQKKVNIIYPVIDLTGKRELISLNTPFFGLVDIQFQLGSVYVKTVPFDGIEEMMITVYRGKPNEKSLNDDVISVSGLIEVGKDGIILGAGGSTEAVFQWQEGLTDVLVVVKTLDVSKKQIRSITFYLQYFQKSKHKNQLLNLFQ